MNGGRGRLLVTTPWFPPAHAGWPYPFIGQSCVALAELGWQVRVLVVRPWKPAALARVLGSRPEGPIDAGTFPLLGGIDTIHTLSFPRQIMTTAANTLLDRRVQGWLGRNAKAMDEADAVLVHTEGLAPAVVPLCRAAGRAVTAVVHGLNTSRAFLEAPRQKARIAGALAKADRLVLVGEPLRDYFSSYTGRSDHIRVVPNGVDAPATATAALADGRAVQLVSVANLEVGKGIDLAIRALARLRDEGQASWSFRIVGAGAERGPLGRLVTDLALGDHVTFEGAVANARVMQILAECDVLVLPSYREAFGIAYLEAMATGLLAIGVEGQGPSQFIRHGETGLLVAPRSADAVADALRPILKGERVRYRDIATAGAKEARRNWSWERHARSLDGVIGEAIHDNRMGRGD